MASTGSRLRAVAVVLGLALMGVAGARADDYPTRPITLVLPLAPGGAMDIIARGLFAPMLQARLGKPVIVENRTGGGTVVAANYVAKSEPDGYTLFFVPAGTLTTNVTLYKSLPYDPIKDFVPISMTSKVGFVLVVNPDLPVKSLQDLLGYIKARPGKLSYGSPGIGSAPHLAFEMMDRDAGLQMVHVPYRGTPPVMNDVIAGHIQMGLGDPPIARSLINDGKLRGLAVSSATRVPSVPDLPTMAEAGLPGYEAVSWHMVVAPAGTPKPVVDKLHQAFQQILETPEFKQQVVTLGLNPIVSPNPDELKTYLAAEVRRWGDVVRQVGIAGAE
jgi:tripartite-type tricarboxylate transporter receptor subunit TctC